MSIVPLGPHHDFWHVVCSLEIQQYQPFPLLHLVHAAAYGICQGEYLPVLPITGGKHDT